jgi:hypothetical protein
LSVELRVVVFCDRIQLIRIGRKLALKGEAHRVIEKKTYPFAATEQIVQDEAIKALEIALSDLPAKPAYAQLILSGHFVNYAMVELNQSLKNEAEELAYAKHCFGKLYGAVAEDWEIRLNHDYEGTQQIASAVNALFLQNLRAVFARLNIRLKSVQPSLMVAYNNAHSDLHNQDAWFVLHEHGRMCIGLVRQGHWLSVRTFNVADNWFEKLNEILDREAYLSETDISSDKILLWAPEYVKTDFPKSDRWKVQQLKPEIRASFAADFEEQYAVAMCR